MIIVQDILSAVERMKAALETYNAAEGAALAARDAARAADEKSAVEKQSALTAIAELQMLLADVQDRNRPAGANPVPEVEPNREF